MKNRTTEARRHGEKNALRLCASAVILFFTTNLFSEEITQTLNSNWQFSELNKNEWLPATVPGTIHTDLLANGKIPDPFTGLNEQKVQWVETKTWEYKTTFDCDPKLWKEQHREIVFDGLDTYADVYLNDSLVFTGDNMFRNYRYDVTKFLKKEKNVLRIIFHPAADLIVKNRSLGDIKNLPGGDRVYIRKAQYQFGWDWGPRLVTCGIWRAVHLEGWSGFDMRDVRIITRKISNDTAFLRMDAPVTGTPGKKLHFTIRDNNGIYFDSDLFPQDKFFNNISVPFVIPHPKLWWCNGMGKPELYHFEITCTSGHVKDMETVTTGIRTIEVDTLDATAAPAFQFVLNGKPVFIKGANWIPCDNFLPRVTTEKYYSLLKSAQQSNMNMLRVWGGGVYEDDRFYTICDSLGIMVWQDFMFACGMYPGNENFLFSEKQEAKDNIIRLADHPCISLWCGNNENDEGWNNWEWQKNFSAAEKNKIAADYQALFGYGSALNKTVTEYLYSFPYIASSPATGWGHDEAYRKGDVHYWGVWWGNEPFSAYDTHVGKFVSEYGFQGLPSLSTFRNFCGNDSLSLNDSCVQAHEKNEGAFAKMNTYMKSSYPVPKTFDDYIYVSQVMQRDAVARAIEAHRRATGYCMGTLFWQYNDCWPSVSWSSTDWYGQPKLLQYSLRTLYSPILISTIEKKDSVLVYIVNDDTISHAGFFALTSSDFTGAWLNQVMVQHINVPAGTSGIYLTIEKKHLLDTLPENKVVMQVTFAYECPGNNFSYAHCDHYFVPVNQLDLPKDAGLSSLISADPAKGTYTITLRASHLAKNIYLRCGDPGAQFSDNGFDLLPGESRDIVVHTLLSLADLNKSLSIRVMNDLR